MGGMPAQFRLRARRIGLHRCDIACTARGLYGRDRLAAGAFKGADHIDHAIALAGADVEGPRAGGAGGIVDGGNMRAGQIDDMDVIAQSGAVGRVGCASS